MLQLFGPTRNSLPAEFPCDECVAWASPTFPLWTGPSPGSSYGGKPIIEYDGEPAFAELAIVRAFGSNGCSAVWMSPGNRRLTFRSAFWGKPRPPVVPASLAAILAKAAAQRDGSYKGTWDVAAWPADSRSPRLADLRFVESKRHQRDRIRPEQIGWYMHMRVQGAAREQFLVVDWALAAAASSSPPPRKEHRKDVMSEANDQVSEFSDDSGYFGWLADHPYGYVLSVRGRTQPLLHRATCTHIDRHNNPGALTVRGSRKLCSETKDALREWVLSEGISMSIVLRKCRSCSP